MAKVRDPERYANTPGWVRVVDDFGNQRGYHHVEDVRWLFMRSPTQAEKDGVEITLDWLLERVKEDDNGCLVWTGFITKQGQPQARIVINPHVHATFLVRRLVAKMKFEPGPKFRNANAWMRNRQAGVPTTCSHGCCHPDHVIVRTKKQAMASYRGTHLSLEHKRKISLTKARKSKVDTADVARILLSNEPANKMDAELGMCPGYSSKIRRGNMRVFEATAGVFTGLLAPSNGAFYDDDQQAA